MSATHTSLNVVGRSRYRDLVPRAGGWSLLLSSVVARLPRGLTSLALLLLIRSHYGSLVAAGVTVGAFSLANAAATPAQGSLIDRFGQPRVLVPSAILHAALLVALVAAAHGGTPLPVAVTLAGVAGAMCPPVAACTRALWAQAAMEAWARDRVFALDATLSEVVWTLGPLIVGAVVAVSSPDVAVLLVALLAVLGTTAYSLLPAVRIWRTVGERPPGLGALASPGLRVLLLTVLLVGGCWGVMSVALPAVAVRHSVPALAGLLLAVYSLGSIVGGVCYGGRSWALTTARRYQVLLLLMVISTAPLAAAASSFPATLALALIAGIAWAPVMSCQYSLTGRLAVAGTMTEAFTWINAAFGCGISGGAVAAGVVTRIGIGAPFAAACGGAGLAVAITLVRRRELEA